ncbi:MAG: sugar ABC transporter permease [Bifidobacteriaceae bacterium]|nr:sugar ABC transporter permease [Bifidobacteriaceae bacterium]
MASAIATTKNPKPRAKTNADGTQPSPYSAAKAWKNGDIVTRLSLLIFGLGNLVRKQIVKGILFLAIEILSFTYLFTSGEKYLSKIVTLGEAKQTRVKVNGFWTYQEGDNSVVILLYSVMSIFVILLLILCAVLSMRSAYKAQVAIKNNLRPLTIKEDITSLAYDKAHVALMFFPTLGIIIFSILPLVFMISMAFTSYDKDHVVLFKWVGLENFTKIFASTGSDINPRLFMSVLAWTLVWAFFATFLNFFLGMFMAMIINRKTTRLKGFWRACFSMSIAVPQFVSLLVLHSMLQNDGAINRLLINAGLIDGPLPFLTNATWARVTVIIVNLWVGIPYTIMQITGILQNVPAELYEAAELDGASWWERYTNVTLPYIFFVMTPYLITTFTGNVNNFNVIYLLTGGAPTPIGDSAGKTDLLITWLYKLTVDKANYNLGAVIGIMTFIVLSIVALVTYRSSGSYKNEEGFR